MRIFYAGDSEAGGPANYLLGILHAMRAKVVHIPPGRKLSAAIFKKHFDVIILSDFSRKDAPLSAQKAIARQTARGTGLLMIGGWGSFSGPFGKWRGSVVEKLLPVHCSKKDDRLNFPGGAFIVMARISPARGGPAFGGRSFVGPPDLLRMTAPSGNFKNPPVICGLNQIQPKPGSFVVLTAQRLVDRKQFPLLIVSKRGKSAALATDLAPHWCGGMVDWGSKRLKLRVTRKIQIEVGDLYVRFVSSLIRWLIHI